MMANQTAMADVYTDFQGLGQLKAAASNRQGEVNREVAQQFESMFLQMMLKSMRQTVGKGLMDSSQTEMAQGMYDQQLALQLSKQGAIGIGDMVLREIGGAPDYKDSAQQTGAADTKREFPINPHSTALSFMGIPTSRRMATDHQPAWQTSLLKEAPTASVAPPYRKSARFNSPNAFLEQLGPTAEKAAEMLGVDSKAILAIAALETGWGKHVMRDAQGNSSNNLFGIKADKRWQDDHVMANTLEFEQGAMRKKREPFRAYASPEESVMDFARFIRSNPRYEQALEHAHDRERFVEELHKAGYATDPDYADKVKAVMQTVSRKTDTRQA